MSIRSELKRRHRLASMPDAQIRIRWDRIGALVLGGASALSMVSIFLWCLYLLSEL